MTTLPPVRVPTLRIRALLGESAELKLVLLAGEQGLDRTIILHRVQKPGLALAGFVPQPHPEHIQILGVTEMSYLASLPPDEARRSTENFLALDPACVVVTRGQDVSQDLLDAANRLGIPLLRTPIASSIAMASMQKFIGLALAPTVSLHGVLVDVLGIGILLFGKSGIGKSEAALELIMRGHRLVADDLVEVRRFAGDQIVGWASALIKHHMEVRGLGIINIKDMFGVAAVRDEKKIELVLELSRWDDGEAVERLGLDQLTFPILDVPVPMLRIPVSPGRNVSSLVEVAARNRLLQQRGHHSAREFQERLDQALAQASQPRLGEDVE